MNNNGLIAQIYETYYGYMLNFAKKYMSESDAEDIVHNVFMKLITDTEWLEKLIRKSEHPYEQRRILFTFLRNACCNFYRHIKIKNRIFSDISDSEYEICTNPEHEYQNIDIIKLIKLFIDDLSEQNRNIFMQYYIEGYSIQEIVEQSGLSKRAIEDRLYRMLNFLKNKMQR